MERFADRGWLAGPGSDFVRQGSRRRDARRANGSAARVARGSEVKILVTGAAGQLGRCLPAALGQHEVVALERGALDITRLEQVRAVIAGYRPATVINAAAFNDVDGAESRQAEAYAINAAG